MMPPPSPIAVFPETRLYCSVRSVLVEIPPPLAVEPEAELPLIVDP
jgi:hypothetical protein